jgi:AP2 domain
MVATVEVKDCTSIQSNKFTVTEVVLANRRLRARVDTADLPKILSTSLRWTAFWHPGSKTFYVYASIQGKRVYLHRLITDAPAGLVVDHRDHDGLNNCRSNLRSVIQGENVRNARRVPGKNGRGVRWYAPTGRWKARSKVQGREIHLGYFDTKAEAAAKVQEFLAKLGVSQ